MTGSTAPPRLLLPRLTVRGWGVLAASGVAVITAYLSSWRDLLFTGIFLFAVVAVAVLSVRFRVAVLDVRRRMEPSVVGSGETVAVTMRVENRAWLRSPKDSWRDVHPLGFPPRDFQPLPTLAGRGERDSAAILRYPLIARARGLYEIGPLVVRRTDPFGLTAHEQVIGGTETLTVLPRLTGLSGGIPGRTSSADSSVRHWDAGRGTDDVIAREYRSGDALRHVHWRATAHRGELMVRQEQRDEESGAVILLDTRREAFLSADSFEWAVEFAASVLIHLERVGCKATLLQTVADPAERARTNARNTRDSLIELATVTRRIDPGASASYLRTLSASAATAGLPLFAVLGVTDPAELRRLAPLRPHSGVAGLVLVSDFGTEPPDELWHAGWRCATARPGDDPAVVWSLIGTGTAAAGVAPHG